MECEKLPCQDWVLARSREKNFRELERFGSGMSVVSGSDEESDGFEDLRRYSSMSMQQTGKRPSSQYKGVVPQLNGRWGAQIYEKHQRVWLGTFNREEAAATAYDRAALKFRGQDAMTNFSPAGGGDLEARFMREHTREEIIEMIRKHNYDKEFEHHCKRMIMTAAQSASINSSEQPGSERPGHSETGAKQLDDGNGNAAMVGLLFEKAVTPSDVGKLNRLVIPKLNAEKYFPLDVDSSDKGLLMHFEDNTGKVWIFRYSYWKSSQSYVLTKGWSWFVKDKKLKVGDFVSFHRGSSEPYQLYIGWRRGPSVQPQLGVGCQHRQSKMEMVYSFNPGTRATVVSNAQWMPILWPSSRNSDAFMQSNSNSFPVVNKVCHLDDLLSHRPATDLNGAIPFRFSEPPSKQTDQDSFYDINPDGVPTMDLYLSFDNPLNSGEGSTNIKQLHPFVNPARPSEVQELETAKHKATSSLDPASKKGVRIFGVTLAES